MKQRLHKLSGCLICFLLLFITTAGFTAPKTQLRVGWYLVDGLHDYETETGYYRGYDYDYLQAIAQYTGWNYIFVVEPFSDCMEDLAAGRLDLVGGLDWSQERAERFTFTKNNIGQAGPRLIARETDMRYAFEDYEGFNGMSIGVIKGSIFETDIQKYAGEHAFACTIVPFTNQTEMFRAFQAGEVDALLVSGTRKISGVRILAQMDLRNLYFACPKDKPEIAGEIDKALVKIRFFNRSFDQDIYAKYFAVTYTPAVAFSVEEQKYIKEFFQHKDSIEVLYDPAWMPIEAKDPVTGEFTGILRDIFDLLAQRTGLKFKFVAADSYRQTMEQYNKSADLFADMAYSFRWANLQDAYVTYPILDLQIFRVFNNNQHQGEEKVALPNGYYLSRAVQEQMSQQQRSPSFVYFDTMEECLDAVRNRAADSTYINSYELNYYMEKLQLEHLGMQSIEGFILHYGIGVSRHTGPLMLSIISRGLTGISPAEINKIVLKRSQQRLQPTLTDRLYANPLRGLALVILALVVLGLLIFFYLSSRYNKRQKEALQAANAAKSEFLSRMSHDIRTPINAITNMTAFAKEDIDDKRLVRDELDKIASSSRHLLSLINDVLDISKAESNRIELHPEPYPFEEHIQDLRHVFEPLCRKQGLNFVVAGGQGGNRVPIVDRVRFNQIVMNLLSNAVKFTPAGGTVSYISQSKALPDGQFDCSFTVQDTGIGMSTKFQSIMFEPFSQEHDNPKRAHLEAGTGLGLSIVKRLVDLMQGSVAVKSTIGQGTAITIHLPLATADEEQLAELAQKNTEKTMAAKERVQLKGKVLLAEDNAINTEIAVRLLKGFGLSVVTAKNGQEAVREFAASAPQMFAAVLMDIQMPVLNGYDTTKAIRAMDRPDAKTVPIIAMTADVFADAVAKSKNCGMDAHIGKPINPQDLYEILTKYLQ